MGSLYESTDCCRLGDVSEWMKLDLSMPQMKVLMLLNNHGTLKVSEIAEKWELPFEYDRTAQPP